MTQVENNNGLQLAGISSVEGPLILVKDTGIVSYDEFVEIIDSEGQTRLGRVLEVGEGFAVIEVFSGTAGLNIQNTKIRFTGQPLHVPVAREMLGRIFNGVGKAMDGGPEPLAEEFADINGQPINPTARLYPVDYIQTGISTIDAMNTLVMGQKLPIFSGSGIPHDLLASQIVRQARVGDVAGGVSKKTEGFAIVFAAMGIKHDVAEYFRKSFTESGALNRVAMFLNLADDPAVERLVTPKVALTLAEYLAFRCDQHVLVVMTDMTNYCEALRQISNKRGEVPSRKGYPGYMYSDLASIYERTGRIEGSNGSITQLPILTMPNDDITHPIPDITGYITEGQIVLSRELSQQDIYPPINVLPSLSRLMKDGIGEGKTRADHPDLASQLYSAYAHVQDVRSLASVIGEEELGAMDQLYFSFGNAFEDQFVRQNIDENRSIEQSLDIAWKLISMFPQTELTRLKEAELTKYYGAS